MAKVDLDDFAEANAPKIKIRELIELASKFCAVEFGSRELLGVGDTWKEAVQNAANSGFGDRQFYKYRVPTILVPQFQEETSEV